MRNSRLYNKLHIIHTYVQMYMCKKKIVLKFNNIFQDLKERYFKKFVNKIFET